MPSIFDYLFGGSQAANAAGGMTPGINPVAPRPPSILDTPEYGRERTLDALQGLAAGLVQAGAPSPYPVDFGTTLGMAGAGIGRGMAGSEDRYLKRAMVNSQVRKNEAELARDSALNDLFKGGGPSAPAPSPTIGNGPATAAAPGDPASVIGGMESGGKYDAVGPVANGQGHRAYGKYQVLEPNVPVWTAEVLGKPMTPQEFLANPQAQDAVFKAKFGQYSAKYGPEGAAKAWFAGEGGMNNPNAKDVLGTSVAGYGQKFSAGSAPALPPQGDAVPAADGSGTPVQPAQYTPQAGAAPPAAIPQFKTVQDVVNSIPPAVRQLAPGMTTEGKLQMLMKYADPGTEAVLDTQTNQVVFAPKNLLGRDPRYQPVEGAKLGMDRERLGLDKDRAAREAANAKVTVGPGGQTQPNETVLQYERRIKELEDQFKQGEEKRKQEAGQSEKTFGQEKQVRQEYETQPAVKSYRVVVPMMEAAAKAGPTRAGDLNLVYAFAKLMDPDSVVRESETAGVQATGNLGDRVMGYVGMLNGNPTLSPETRAKLMDELQTRFVALKESNDVLASQYTDIATAYGLDPSRVVIPIRKPGVGKTAEGNQPTQQELKGWSATGPQTGGVRLQYVPGKGTVPVPK